jgi:hypothetical protein
MQHYEILDGLSFRAEITPKSSPTTAVYLLLYTKRGFDVLRPKAKGEPIDLREARL